MATKTLISSANFTSLKGIPKDELSYADDIQLGVELYTNLLGQTVKEDDFINELIKNGFYPPQVIIKKSGFSINFNNKEIPLAATVDFSEIKKDKDKSYLHLTAGNKKIGLSLRYELLESCEYDSRELFDLIDPKDAVKTAEFLLTIIVPPVQSSLPIGIYKVKKIEISTKSAKVYTEDGNSVLVANSISDKTEYIRSWQGFIYSCDEVGKVSAGISWMMNTIPLPDKEKLTEIGVPECKIGSQYEIIGTTEKLFEGNIIYSATFRCLVSNVIFAIRSDANTNQASKIATSCNKKRYCKVVKINQPTGNMKYPKAEFSFYSNNQVLETVDVKNQEVIENVDTEETSISEDTVIKSKTKKTKETIVA